MGEATAWQNRMLDKIYPIVYMDAMHIKKILTYNIIRYK